MRCYVIDAIKENKKEYFNFLSEYNSLENAINKTQ